MVLGDRQSRRTAFFLVTIILIIILVLAFISGGIGGVFGVLSSFIRLILLVLFLGFIFYVVHFLFFKKHRIDVPYENWKVFRKSALDNGADMMADLMLTGDKDHGTKRFMTIKGYLRILGYDGKEYDMFVGKRNSWNLMEDQKIVLLEPNTHSDLIGDVYVYGISLIQKYNFYWLNTMTLDYGAIDKFVSSETFRTLIHYTLGDMKGLVDRATGLDPDFNKQRQQEKLLKIPILSGQQPDQK